MSAKLSPWRVMLLVLALLGLNFGASHATTALARTPQPVTSQTPPEVTSGKAQLLGAYDPQQTLRLVIGLYPTNTAAAQQFLRDVQNKHSPLFHHFLTGAEWTARFGPTVQGEQAVADWAGAHGLTVAKRYPNRLLVDVSGSVAAIEQALSIHINRYQLGNRTFYSNDRDPQYPSTLKAVIQNTTGLNNLALAHSNAHSLPAKGPAPVAPTTTPQMQKGADWVHISGNPKMRPKPSTAKRGQGIGVPKFTNGYIDPPNLWNSEAYNFSALYNQGHCCNPTGNSGGTPPDTSIAIVTGCLFSVNDLQQFANQYGLAFDVNWSGYDGASCGDPNGIITPNFETTLDVEYSTAMSNSFGCYCTTAHLFVYYGQSLDGNGNPSPGGNNISLQTLIDGYNVAASDNNGNGNARSFSTSWGGAESSWGGSVDTADNIFSSMSGQGWTMTDAAGDSGAYADGSTLNIQYPSSDPNLVSAGGTELGLYSDGSYASEIAWTGGGGGCSSHFSTPSYQTNDPCGGVRATPDVSLNASCNSGQALYINGGWGGACGTSEVAPELAGFFAQENAYLLAEGNICFNPTCSPFGNANYPIYTEALINNAPHFPYYDITSGNNGGPFPGSGYNAGPGYDLATGWGSANILQLAWNINWQDFTDNGRPNISYAGPTTGKWYNTDQTVSWTATDTGGPGTPSGISGFNQAWDFDPGDPGNPGTPGCCSPFFGPQFPNATSGYLDLASAGQGCHTANVRAWDNMGFETGLDNTYGSVCYDTLPPVTTSSLSGTQTGCSGQYFSPVTVTLSASDPPPGSGVASTSYQIDGGAVTTYGSPFTVSGAGSHTITFHSTDVAGNVESTNTTSFTIGAAATLSLSPTSGIVGSSTTAIGTGFKAGETVKLYWDSTSSTPLASVTASGTCGLSVKVTIPHAAKGSHSVIAVGQTSGQKATASFTVNPSLTMSPTLGHAGSAATVTLTGYGNGENVTVKWNCASAGCGSSTVLTTGTASSTGDFSHAVTIPNGQAPGPYAVGGIGSAGSFASTTFEVVTFTNVAWSTGAAIPRAHVEAASAVSGAKVYVIDGGTTDSSEGGGDTGNTTVDIYTPASNTWASGPANALARNQNPLATTIGGKVYLIGGTHSGTSVRPVEVLTLSSNTWSTLPSTANLPASLNGAYHCGAALGTKIYYFEQAGIGVFDTTTSTWSVKASSSLLNPNSDCQAAATGSDNIAITGPGDGHNDPSAQRMLYYTASSNAMIKLIATTNPLAEHAYVVLNSQSVVAGGDYGSTLAQIIPVGARFTINATAMPSSRDDIVSAVVNGKLYMMGGQSGTIKTPAVMIGTPTG